MDTTIFLQREEKLSDNLESFSKIYGESKTYIEPCRTSKMELFAKKFNSFQSLTIFAKSSILYI